MRFSEKIWIPERVPCPKLPGKHIDARESPFLQQAKKDTTMKPASMLIFLILTMTGSEAMTAEQSATVPFLHNGITAHRGNSAELPENTIAAFQGGIDAEADWLEMDIFRTKDGKLVVTHDRTTKRVGDKSLVVPDSTYEELLTVDVAADFRKRNNKSIQEVPKHTIPLLEDVLRLVMTQQKTRVSIQPKMACVAEAIAIVKKLKAESWVGFNDGNLDYMTEVKRLAPEIPVFWDRGQSDIDSDLQIANEHGFESLVLHHRSVTKEKVDQIHAAGLEAGAWTVNDRETILWMLALGVDRIYTDDPRLLLRLFDARRFHSVPCEGTYSRHLQGVCTNDRDAIYWPFTDVLIKTDLDGNVVKQIPVANHHGDLCHVDGKLYVAVNLGQFNQPAGRADSWVYVYDADTLEELARHETQEVVHGAGGMACHDGRFMVVGGLPPGTDENYLYEYDKSFRFVKRHVLASGYTLMGIQTAAFAEGHWWLGCYGKPPVLLKADESFQLVGNWQFNGSVGVVSLADGRFLIGESKRINGKGYTGAVKIALPDGKTGFRTHTP